MDERLALILWPSLGALLALVCLYFALRAAKRQRLVENLPTSKTTGVFIGLVELKGTAEAEAPLHSFLAEQNCVYYTWSVEEHWSRTVTETYRDSKGVTRTRTRRESGWKTVDSGGEQIDFYLQDDCGAIRVVPEEAKIEPVQVFDTTCSQTDPLYYAKGPAFAVPHSDFRRRFQERAIPLHASIYVMGKAREREDIVAPEIAHDGDAPMFLISTRTEEAVRLGLRWRFWLLGFLGLALSVGGFLVRDAVLERDLAGFVPTYIVAALGYAFVWLIGWTWMAYNSLIDLRERVQQAWSNTDVQLKRRNDLIPNLVLVVQGMRDYEQQLQTELAELRSQLQATRPGQAGPDHHACAPLVAAVIERYPELKANDSFLQLQHELVNTEQRIALARSYFNDITTFYNTRLQIIPDRFIASLGRMRPETLMSAADFERAPVEVSFAQ